MNSTMIFKISLKNLLKRPIRTFLLFFSIVIVSTILTVMLSLINGIDHTLFKAATTLFSGHVNVAGFYKISSSSASPVVTEFPKIKAILKEEVFENKIDLIIDRVKGWGKFVSDESSLQVPIVGVDSLQETQLKEVLKIPASIPFAVPKSVVFFKSHAKKLKIKVGDIVTLFLPTYRNINNTMDLKVTYIIPDIGFLSSFCVFMNNDDLRNLYQMRSDSTGQLMLYLKDVKRVPEMENQLRKLFKEKGYQLMTDDSNPFWMKFEEVVNQPWIKQKLDITSWTDEISMMKWVILFFDTLSFIFVSFMMTIISVGMMNSLWVSVKERTTEIGTLRAIGMQKRSLYFLISSEALILTLSAILVGALTSSLIIYLVNLAKIEITSEALQMVLLMDKITLIPNGIKTAFYLTLILFFSLMGALYPAYIATKISPLNAINKID